MAYDTTSPLAAERAAQEAGGGGEVRGQAVNTPLVQARRLAFQTQMAAVQQTFEDPSDDPSSVRCAVDPGVLNDTLMLDALRTIARLSREAGDSLARSQGRRHAVSGRTPGGDSGVGGLSARFESGADGIEAIGHDRVGGTSYGKYQLSSKAGTMDRFIAYLRGQEPGWASRLRAAGPADTGSCEGRMPRVWRQIAAENPERFEALQHEFVRNEHYLPARDKIMESTGVDIESGPPALREVLWSTSVQHGASGAARIFNRVIAEVLDTGAAGASDRRIIDKVYADRQKQFASSTDRVRASVRNRLREERNLALAMLDSGPVRRVV